MDQKKIDRINELARKSKAEGLSEEEKAEQATLRREFIESYKRSLEIFFNISRLFVVFSYASIGLSLA